MKLLLMLMLSLLPATAAAQRWLEIEASDRPITVAASGIVTSADALRFGPPPNRSWRVAITYLAPEGSRVKKGDPLARFDGSRTDDRIREVSAELNARRSELESLLEIQQREIEESKVQLAAAESAADKAARKADADAELFASLEYKKLVEQRDITRALHENEKQRSELSARVRVSRRAELEADIRRLESELAGARRELEGFTITAPRSYPGRLCSANARSGPNGSKAGSAITRAAPLPSSSAGWNRSTTSPRAGGRSASRRARPTMIAMWPSCPHL